MEDLVERILPSLSSEKVTDVVKCLTESGVETVADLQFVQEGDLLDVLKPIQIRKLMQAWKLKGICFFLDHIGKT